MWQSVKVLNVFNTLTLIQIFWKTKTFFKKLEYRFLVESTKIENTSFPYKTAISEANVKANRMVTTLFFRKFCVSLRTSYNELIWCTNDPNAYILSFCKSWIFIWRCFFPVIILKTTFYGKLFVAGCIPFPCSGLMKDFWSMFDRRLSLYLKELITIARYNHLKRAFNMYQMNS